MDLEEKKALDTKAIIKKKVYDNIASWLPLLLPSNELVEIVDASNTSM